MVKPLRIAAPICLLAGLLDTGQGRVSANRTETISGGARYARALERLSAVQSLQIFQVQRFFQHGPLSRPSGIVINFRYRTSHGAERTWIGLNPVGKLVRIERIQVGKTVCQKTPDANHGRWERYPFPLLAGNGPADDLFHTLPENGILLPPLVVPAGSFQSLSFRPTAVRLGHGTREPAVAVTIIRPVVGDGGPNPVRYRGKTYEATGAREHGVLTINRRTGLPIAYASTIWDLIRPGPEMGRGPGVLAERVAVNFAYQRVTVRLPGHGGDSC